MWTPGAANLIDVGAIRAFQSVEGLPMDGVAGSAVWRDLLRAVAKGHNNPNGYSYALASKASPETLTVWHDGHVVLHTLANTGIPVAPTADGTFPVYLRMPFQVMQGTNPDGSHYADPVHERRLLQRRRCAALLPARVIRVPAEPGLRRATAGAVGHGLSLHDLRQPGHGVVTAGQPVSRQMISPSARSAVGVIPARRATAAEAAWSGRIAATMVMTWCSRSQPMRA